MDVDDRLGLLSNTEYAYFRTVGGATLVAVCCGVALYALLVAMSEPYG